MISDVEIPSVLCVGTNIPEQSGKRKPTDKAWQDQALQQIAEDEHKNAWQRLEPCSSALLLVLSCCFCVNLGKARLLYYLLFSQVFRKTKNCSLYRVSCDVEIIRLAGSAEPGRPSFTAVANSLSSSFHKHGSYFMLYKGRFAALLYFHSCAAPSDRLYSAE